jgi:hypothetical protein
VVERLLVLHHPIFLEGRRQMDRLAGALEKIGHSLAKKHFEAE